VPVPALVGLLICIGATPADAEEVAQDAFVKLITRWDDPQAWVRAVAVRKLISRLRRARVARQGLRRLAGLGRAVDHPPPDPDAVDLAAALRTLPPAQRAVLVLHHALDLPVERIATDLGMPAGTVKSRLELPKLLERSTPGAVAPFAHVHAKARRRARRRGRAAVIATVLAVAGALTVVRFAVVGDNPPPDPSPTQVVGPPPDRISVNGRDLVRTGDDVEMGTVRIDRDDPATLVVPAGMNAPAADPHCVPHTVVRILSQNARAVEIGAFAYGPADPPAGPVMCPDIRYPDLLAIAESLQVRR
jgi:RNA polymerase sigma factor (sigma-70 family)